MQFYAHSVINTTLRNWYSTTYVTVLRVTGGPTETYLDFQRMFSCIETSIYLYGPRKGYLSARAM